MIFGSFSIGVPYLLGLLASALGDPVEHSRAVGTLLPGLSRLPTTFVWTRATLSAHFPFYFADSFLLASLCRLQRCLRTATPARWVVSAAVGCMAATTARLASMARAVIFCADLACCSKSIFAYRCRVGGLSDVERVSAL